MELAFLQRGAAVICRHGAIFGKLSAYFNAAEMMMALLDRRQDKLGIAKTKWTSGIRNRLSDSVQTKQENIM